MKHLKQILHHTSKALTVTDLKHMYGIMWSEQGSNTRLAEEETVFLRVTLGGM
jgi:hypothetical protein